MQKTAQYLIERSTLPEVLPLFEAHHGYKGAGQLATEVFAVRENGRIVAAFVWNPPAPGAAKALSQDCPWLVLSLTRMVALPKTERILKHISRPLRKIMMAQIDRHRWPILVTYSDSSLNHNGFVYQCSGWTKDGVQKNRIFEDKSGVRRSSYSNGGQAEGRIFKGHAEITRWIHRIVPIGQGLDFFHQGGWCRQKIAGKVWRSGGQAFGFERELF